MGVFEKSGRQAADLGVLIGRAQGWSAAAVSDKPRPRPMASPARLCHTLRWPRDGYAFFMLDLVLLASVMAQPDNDLCYPRLENRLD